MLLLQYALLALAMLGIACLPGPNWGKQAREGSMRFAHASATFPPSNFASMDQLSTSTKEMADHLAFSLLHGICPWSYERLCVVSCCLAYVHNAGC